MNRKTILNILIAIIAIIVGVTEIINKKYLFAGLSAIIVIIAIISAIKEAKNK